MHEGHRQRMLRRLEQNEESLEEHELLEIMLFNAIPRKNTNPVAHELIRSFGSIEGVLRASFEQLQTVSGVGAETAAYLRIAGILNGRVKYSEQTFPAGLNPASFEEFLSARYCGYATEVFEIFFLDAHGKAMHCSRFTDYSETSATVSIDKLNKLFAAHEPSGMLAAHNHPSAPSLPSAADDKFTAHLALYCSVHRVKFYDHIIIGTDGAYSYFKQRRLDEIRNEYNVAALIDKKFK